jgi:hypothetical protein
VLSFQSPQFVARGALCNAAAFQKIRRISQPLSELRSVNL